MRKSILGLSAVSLLALTAPAFADDAPAPAVTVTGNVALVSDYRFRGFSQSSQNAAIQGGITVTDKSGLYAGTWGSSITFAGGTEVDLFAGYSKQIAPGITADIGLLYYLYPKHKAITGDINTDFFEPYFNLTGAVGPATIKVGVNYAWAQDALAVETCDSESEVCTSSNKSAVYFHAEPSIAIPNSPLGLNGHIGYAVSDAFPGGSDGKVFDYSFGATAAWKMLTFGVNYVGTDEPGSPRGADGGVVFSLTAAF